MPLTPHKNIKTYIIGFVLGVVVIIAISLSMWRLNMQKEQGEESQEQLIREEQEEQKRQALKESLESLTPPASKSKTTQEPLSEEETAIYKSLNPSASKDALIIKKDILDSLTAPQNP